MIKHDNLLKRYFDAIVIALTLFAAMEVPLHLSLRYTTPYWIKMIHLTYPILFSIDIFLSFFTTIIVDGQEITSKKIIAKRYLTSWFVVDLISATPLDFIFPEGWISELNNIARAVRLFSPRYIQMLMMVRLIRLHHIFPFLKDKRRKKN